MAKILVVDDRPTNRQLLFTLLGYVGHHVIEGADGAEGLAQARTQHPDLIITDILMPKMSGLELVQHLRLDAALQSIPIIFFTASYSEPHALRLAQTCGVQIVLPKPCEPEKILAAVAAALNEQVAQVPEDARQQVTVAVRDATLAENMLSDYLRDLNAVKRGFTAIIERTPQTPLALAEKDELGDMFSKTIAGLTLMTARLSTLVQAGLDLLHERDAAQAVRHCFDAACRVMGSAYAAIHVTNQSADNFIFAKGIDTALYAQQGGRDLPVLSELLTRREPIRIVAAADSHLADFPAPHPPIKNFLGVPVASADQIYGWMYFANRLGANEFSEEDQRVAATLALQLALLHENFLLYDLLQNHAVKLELEIAERRHVELQLLRLNESLEARVAARTAELQQANKELEAYSFSVSHDLRAPLITIAGFTKLLMQESDCNAEQKTFLQHIETAVQRTMQIIDSLLRLAHLSRQALVKVQVDVAELVTEVLAQLRLQEQGREMDIEVQALPPCNCDASMLRQVYVNLLSNAFKFTRQQPHPKVTVGWRTQADGGAYFVADNGVGFNPAHAEKLFAAFQRDHSETQFEGTGIGLSIVERIVERHGGSVWAESKVGEGAAFYFTLA